MVIVIAKTIEMKIVRVDLSSRLTSTHVLIHAKSVSIVEEHVIWALSMVFLLLPHPQGQFFSISG
jgi:hypothetical protein